MGKTGRNEQRKLMATFVNGCALAVLATAVVVPVVQVAGTRFGGWACVGAVGLGGCLAALAWFLLRDLEE